jgi:hypothetical protein
MMEHRQRRRWETHMPVVLLGEQGATHCVVLNADPTGVYVRCNKPLNIGERASLALVARTEGATRLLRVPARVVRSGPDGAGLVVEPAAIPLRDMLPPPAAPRFAPLAPQVPTTRGYRYRKPTPRTRSRW